jgi:hypothetical protein
LRFITKDAEKAATGGRGKTTGAVNKRTLKIVVGLVALSFLLPLLLVALFLCCERVRGRMGLAHCRRELIAKGEILTPQAFASARPAGENGAPEIIAAASGLKKGGVMPNHYPPVMKLMPSGRAVVGFREEKWVEEGAAYRWDRLADELDANEPALARVRVALQKPVLDNELDYSRGASMRLTHLSPPKQLSQWFGARAQLELHAGQTHAAVDDLVAQIELVRALARDRIVISELVRVAIASVARAGTWEALQADGWSDEDLAKLQQAWENQHFAAGMIDGLRGELVFSEATYRQLRHSNHWAFQVWFTMEDYGPESDRPLWERGLRRVPHGDAVADFVKEQVYCRIWRFAWLEQNERHYLQEVEKLLTITRAAAAEKSWAGAQPALARFEGQASNRNLYDRLRYPDISSPLSLTRCGGRSMRAETERSIILCAIALKRYSLRHGSPPPSLASLAPEFLPAVPIDYMDGKPMKYKLNSDGRFVLYSVGEDGIDDGGDPGLAPGKTNVRSPWDRKDYVWPTPALTEEIEAYRAEGFRN